MSGYEWVMLQLSFSAVCQHMHACGYTLYEVFLNSSFYIPAVISGYQVQTSNCVLLTVEMFLLGFSEL